MKEITFVVPLVPPSVNHYKGRDKRGHWYVKAEGIAFKNAIPFFAPGRMDDSVKEYTLEVMVFFGKKQKGDGDNLFKCLADGLVEAGIIKSDAHIKRWMIELSRDWDNPRSVITIKEYTPSYELLAHHRSASGRFPDK